jgi:hypothetical protein
MKGYYSITGLSMSTNYRDSLDYFSKMASVLATINPEMEICVESSCPKRTKIYFDGMLKDGSKVNFSWGKKGNLDSTVTAGELKDFLGKFSQITSSYEEIYRYSDSEFDYVYHTRKPPRKFSFKPKGIDYLSSINITHKRKQCRFKDRKRYSGRINIDLEVIMNGKYLGEFEELVKRLKDEFPEWEFKKNWGVSKVREKVGDEIDNPYVDKYKVYDRLIEEIANGTLPSSDFLKMSGIFNDILPASLENTGDLRQDLIRATILYSMETGQFHRIKDQVGDEKDFIVDAISKTIVSSILKGTFQDNINKFQSEYSSFLGKKSISEILESASVKAKLLETLANTNSEGNVYNVITSEKLSYLNDAQAILKEKMKKLIEEYAKDRDPDIGIHLADLTLIINGY